ncbi:hypothetical protein [Micrococcoides hystricis]|uniref:DUF3311 domain-containing protein n=1 Tax=Micrococcoides hystricis TaxID=1572761 RepID=A0ABV6PAI7_9MICC
MSHSMSRRTVSMYYALFYLLCSLLMIWPGPVFADSVKAMVFGMPFMFFWYVACVLLVFAGTLVAYVLDMRTPEAAAEAAGKGA